MSSIMIVSTIVAVLVLLVCYAFIFQTVDNKRKQKQRLLNALKVRSNNFKYMLSGFPPDFLTQDLCILVNRSLIEIYEQMSKLEPNEPSYVEELAIYTQRLAEAQREQCRGKRPQLESPQQTKIVRTHLQELHSFIEKLLRRNVINGNQAKLYSRQIHKLILQISVDNYLLFARQAQKGEKWRLAAHYYNLARKLLQQENGEENYSTQIAQLDSVIEQLEQQIQEESKDTEESEDEQTASQEWDNFTQQEDDWKKKTVYD